MSLVNTSLSLGGSLTRSVDLETGEIIAPGVPPARKPVARTDGTPGGTGLSYVHISPCVTAYKGASFFKVSRSVEKPVGEKCDELREKIKSKRGKISGFSRYSQTRLRNELAKIRLDSVPEMVTLTYPGDYADDPKVWKRDFDTFDKRLARQFPQSGRIWKLEPQQRGAPHFHVLVWGVCGLDLLTWVFRAWYEVVGSGDEKHLRAGTRVETVKNWGKTSNYMAKYIGKEVNNSWGYAGRWWGVRGRENIPYGDKFVSPVDETKAQNILRHMRGFVYSQMIAGAKTKPDDVRKSIISRARRFRSRNYKSLTITCNPDFWVNRLL